MSTLSVIRAGILGVAAVALPGAAYGAALVFSLRGLEPFIALVAVAVAMAGVQAWLCVRIAHFSAGLAVVLTTLPFLAATLLTLNALATGSAAGFLIQAVILALAVCAAWTATRLAKR